MEKYKYEMHCHTNMVSRCGRVHPKEIAKLYKEKGYNGIVLTDHYSPMTWRKASHLVKPQLATDFYLSAYYEMKKYEDDNFTVLFGMELRHYGTANDYLIYGIEPDWFAKQGNLMKLMEKDVYKLMHEAGFLVYQAHPFRPCITRCAPKYIDGVEIYNGKTKKELNDKAYEWAKANNKLMVSGSDFHKAEHLARGGIVTNSKITNNQELLKVLKSKDFEMIKTY